MKKGQAHSKASVEQMKTAKQKRWAQAMNWDLACDYWDVDLNNGTRNRELKTLTFRSFRDMVESGKSIPDMIRLGYSKHALNFMGVFLQGSISLSKETFVREYKDNGLPLNDISIKYNISRENMSFLRALYNIRITGAKYQNRKKVEPKLTLDQRQIIIGSLFGDAGRMSPSSVKFKHGLPQEKYLMWKFNALINIASKNSLVFQPHITEAGNQSMSCRFYTQANSAIENMLSRFYVQGKKIVPKDLLDELTPLGIAVWFMDDGKCDFGIRKKYLSSPDAYLCTDLFSWDDCEYIRTWFKDRYGINCTMATSSNGLPRIRFSCDTVDKFLTMIRPHIIPSMRYKTDYDKSADRILSKNKPVIDKKSCLEAVNRMPIGKDFLALPLKDQDRITLEIVRLYQEAGSDIMLKDPKATLDDGKAMKYFDSRLLIDKDVITFSTIGHKFCNSHFPHFWKTRCKGRMSPVDVFDNPRYLAEVIRELAIQGRAPTPSRVLHKLRSYRGAKAISSFMPLVATAVYEKYCPHDAKVLDFCSGYGGRLMGAAFCNRVASYYGIEPEPRSHRGLISLKHSLRKLLSVNKDIEICNSTSLLGMSTFPDGLFDFCFTSPPYFDVEEYAESETQSYIQYSTYGEWFDRFLVASATEALRVSKTVAININNTGSYKIADDFRIWMQDNNIRFDENKLQFPKYGGGNKYEPIFILSR